MKKTIKKTSNKQIEDIQQKCIENFEYFCMFLTIKGFDLSKPPGSTGEKENQPFYLKKHQKEFIKFLENKDHSECVVIKCRQIRIN